MAGAKVGVAAKLMCLPGRRGLPDVASADFLGNSVGLLAPTGTKVETRMLKRWKLKGRKRVVR